MNHKRERKTDFHTLGKWGMIELHTWILINFINFEVNNFGNIRFISVKM